jgi:hypothetical protein
VAGAQNLSTNYIRYGAPGMGATGIKCTKLSGLWLSDENFDVSSFELDSSANWHIGGGTQNYDGGLLDGLVFSSFARTRSTGFIYCSGAGGQGGRRGRAESAG